jgi:GMP synthase (glutamine-hydrolysing)
MDKIAVLDYGGQYAHLIANRIRRLEVYSEILPGDVPAEKLEEYKGIILSGGPASVYDENVPQCDKNIFNLNKPVLAICYGMQLLVQNRGGEVSKSEIKEYGKTVLYIKKNEGIFKGLSEQEIVWMSHGDEISRIPESMQKTASTENCNFASVADFEKNFYGVQFHPEVTHTKNGLKILDNFVDICDAKRNWDLSRYIDEQMPDIKEKVGDKKVFMLISGGVDSTVAYTMIQRAVGEKHVHGLFIDTGFIRQYEREEVENAYKKANIKNVHFYYASDTFFRELKDVYDPEEKRKIIGKAFIDVQKKIAEDLNLNPDDWLLGQGTIYPDTIETGGTKHSDVIKTHHNRVEQIQKLIEQGKVLEPISDLYKDEVRKVGEELDVPPEIVWRHPFPGPGLAVRCLCAKENDYPEKHEELQRKINEYIKKYHVSGHILPIKSVGVQGDNRTYKHPFLIHIPKGIPRDWEVLDKISTDITNRFSEINRVLLRLHPRGIVKKNVKRGYLTPERIKLLQKIDYRVTQFIKYHRIYRDIWQFPTVLLPLSLNDDDGESIVLRPVNSEEAMTANFYKMKWEWVDELTDGLREIEGLDGIFYDITNKPPGTIEWE